MKETRFFIGFKKYLFKTKENILVNEIAPRVHNSGHWTIEGCSSSQFKVHMQAVSGIKITQPKLLNECHMVNLIGNEINAVSYTHLTLPTSDLV